MNHTSQMKSTKIGDIPEEWDLVPLSATAAKQPVAFVDGPFGSNLKTSDYTNEGVRLIQLQNVGDGFFIGENQKFTSESKANELSRHLARPGDIVIEKMAEPIVRACFVPNEEEKGIVVVDCIKLTPESKNIDKQFLLSAINSSIVRSQAEARSSGSTRNRIGLSELKKLLVPVPPLKEQQRIAEILSSVDEALEASQAVLEQLRGVKLSALNNFVYRGLPGQHQTFKKVMRLGSVPACWDVQPLDKCAIVQTGLAKGKRFKNDDAVKMPYLHVANVQDGYFDLSEIKQIKVSSEDIERYSLRDGDVLLTEGGDADKLGRGHIWRGQIDPCLHQNHIFCVRVDKNTLLPEFFNYLTSSTYGKTYFLKSAKQTTNLASINSTQLKAFACPIPTLHEQETIVGVLSSIDDRIKFEVTKKRQVEVIKQGLMQQLLTGKLRVTV